MSGLYIAAINMALLKAYGLKKADLPRRVRNMHRCLVRGVYRGERKGWKAWLRFARAVVRLVPKPPAA